MPTGMASTSGYKGLLGKMKGTITIQDRRQDFEPRRSVRDKSYRKTDMIEEIMTAETIVFGCGNTLFGDDGFGPEVVQRLKRETPLPDGVAVEDVGTSIGDILFDLALSPEGPRSIWIVDAVRVQGRSPGEVFELEIEDIPQEKRADFSMHQFPAINLLRELRSQGGVEIRVLAVQSEELPSEVKPGLSGSVRAAVPEALSILRSRALSR